MTYVYWQHKKSGDIYAVRVNEEGVVDGAYGPIRDSEATRTNLPTWRFQEGTGEQVRWRINEFERFNAKR
jgi:hypothetical protein